MPSDTPPLSSSGTIGLLASGGLDSCIMLGHLLERGCCVQPFYVESGLIWQQSERRALQKFLAALARPALGPLVTLELPLGDLYRGHWSMTGVGVPSADSPDDAVYLPGRNVLLIVKAALWCQLHGIDELALAPLGSNPFPDATPEFFSEFQSALNLATQGQVRLIRPFDRLSKREVMRLGRGRPLELTFSCISPQDGLHCGECNKCQERRNAFRLV
ncbi:MAG TPA: 7-cyano-7-deazaguanine synthase, partial [Pirellulales bacterium]|nr:7-cyano-7-deazaguanine synthase [Pirellulales bacterium]